MYNVAQTQLAEPFISALQAAYRHLFTLGEGKLAWLKTSLIQPLKHHLGFRRGDRLFLVYVDTPVYPFDGGRKDAFLRRCHEAKAVPCLFRVDEPTCAQASTSPNWNLMHALTGQSVDPLVWSEGDVVEMTDWEVHDCAIQVVASEVEKKGWRVREWQSSIAVDPSMWIQDAAGPAWVLVRACRYREIALVPPAVSTEKRQLLARLSRRGFFAGVSFANSNDYFDPAQSVGIPLTRGCGLTVGFTGFIPL